MVRPHRDLGACLGSTYGARDLIGHKPGSTVPDWIFAAGDNEQLQASTNVLLLVWLGATVVGLGMGCLWYVRGRWGRACPRRSLGGHCAAMGTCRRHRLPGAGSLLTAQVWSARGDDRCRKGRQSPLPVVCASNRSRIRDCSRTLSYVGRKPSNRLARVGDALLPVICGLTLFLYGSRGPLVFAVVAVIFGPSLIRLVEGRSVGRRALRASLLLPLAIFVGLVALVRLRDFRDDALGGGRVDAESVVRRVSVQANLTVYDSFALAQRDLPIHELRGGQDVVAAISSPVPRALWPGKPTNIAVGAWFRRLYEPSVVDGWPVGPTGEWYLNFGIVGVVVGGVSAELCLQPLALRSLRARAWDTPRSSVLHFCIGCSV